MASSSEAVRKAPDPDPRKVFVIHGRDSRLHVGLFDFLRAVDLRPLEWTSLIDELGHGAPFIGQVLDHAFVVARAVIALFTPDDLASLRPGLRGPNEPLHETEPTGQARPNVLFEAGMAMGRMPNRTILVEIGSLRPFSDISGRHVVKLSNDVAQRQDLINRLRRCGCPVDTSGTAWITTGNFSVA
jgi:predicted nucleotide-binding protein